MSGASTQTTAAPADGSSGAGATASAGGALRSSTAIQRDEAAQRTEAQALTPTFGQRLRSGRLWAMVAVIALVSTGVGLLLQGMISTGGSPDLDPESAKPNGGRAIVEVLRQQGVDVVLASSLDDVRAALGDDGANTTVLLQQRDVSLSADQLAELGGLGAANLVVLKPGPSMLADLGTGISSGGVAPVDTTATAPVGDRCDDPLAEHAPEISLLGGPLYTVPDGDGYAACYVANDRHSIAIDDTGDTRIVALGAVDNLTNEYVAADANGAMGIGLLGDTERLVWYQPGVGDLETSSGVSPIESFVPPWLTPAMILLVFTGIATIVWRGRRLGPLVIERLPVIVRASETMEGRARLYGRTRARLRALDNLRIGTIGRLAKALALPASAGAHEVAIAVAQTIGRPRDEVISILIEADPASDGELVELSDHLLRLERACRAALALPDEPDARVRPDSSPPAAATTPDPTVQTPPVPPAPPRGDA